MKIIGQFDVVLTVPIAVYPGVKLENLDPLHFAIEDSEVTISPLNVEVADIGDGEVEGWLKELRIWIAREAQLKEDHQVSQNLAALEERKFEDILIKATRRFVRAVKLRIEQWNLDTRHPIDSYVYKYFNADMCQ